MKTMFKPSFIIGVALGLSVTAVGDVYRGHGATSVIGQNLAQLTELAELIFVGKVVDMTDGLTEENLPYTEITFEISRSIKGGLAERRTFTYRQFGLLKPRDMGDGKALAITLEGFPRYKVDEEVMVFLYKAASLTGFRTTVGLSQGKFTIEKGKMVNVINNRHLFANMNIERVKLSEEEVRMMAQHSGPVDADRCINLVSRAVKEGLFQRSAVVK